MHARYINQECSELQRGARIQVSKSTRKHKPRKEIVGKIIQRTNFLIVVKFDNYTESFNISELANSKNDDLTFKIVS